MDKIAWHSFSIKDVLKKLDTNPGGLTNHEAILRLEKYGTNELKAPKKTNEIIRFFSQFANPLVYLLIIAAIITYFLKHTVDTIIIFIIVFLNALVGYIQEKKAEKSLDALKKLMSLKSKVIRGNEKMEISAIELVPGDIVIIEEGTKIPADIRIIESESLKADESTLTGESLPVDKKTGVLKNETPVADQDNMLFAGTISDTGHAIGVVVETGKNTKLAKIAEEVTELKDEPTQMQERFKNFSKKLLIVVIWTSAIIFIVGLLKGLDTIEMFLTSVAAAVSIIPEGLPAVITITLAVGVHRMAMQHAIVRKLSAVETLGQITSIASDKTGTLTYNQMTLEKIFLGDEVVEVSGEGYKPFGNFLINGRKINPKNDSDLKHYLIISSLCNNAVLIEEDQEWKILGDPTEGALIVAADKAGVHDENLKKNYPRLDEIPFVSGNHYMATLNHDKKEGKNIIAVKGSIEKILSYSKFIQINGKTEKITSILREKILNYAQNESHKAFRILASAYRYISDTQEKITKKDMDNLIFSGFSAMADPPREEAKLAVKKCHEAGIKVIMVTGDFPGTAKAVAENLGIVDRDARVVSGKDLVNIKPSNLTKIVNEVSVFARVTPEMKLKIVNALKKKGEIVAVTGDGVNDSPILKLADVGIAMGKGGTDVAREASDIVLVDDNFATIAKAIEEGRTIFQNIRRAIFFLLSTNSGEAMILLLSLVIGLPLPLTAIQILWINLITDGTSGFSLAMEPKHEEVLKFKPRPPKEGILNSITSYRIALVALTMTIGTILLYYLDIKTGASARHAQTVAFITMALFQIFNLLNSRSFKTSIFKTRVFSNPYVTGSFIIMLIMTIFTSQTAFFQNIFGTETLNFGEWIKIALISLSIIFVVEIDKLIRNFTKAKY